MREHKFRAWDKEAKVMSVPKTIDDIAIMKDALADMAILDGQIIWLEYTGLHDKNGKEIYEGDIIRHQLNNAGIEKNKTFAISSVIFVRGAFTVDYNPKILIWGLGYNCTEDGQLGHVEVIGNIWENKELLND